MVFRYIKTSFYFFLAIILAKLGLKNKFSILYNCGKSFDKPTCRLPNKSKSDILISCRIYKRIFFSVSKKQNAFIYYNQKSGHAIFDGTLHSSELRYNYIERFTGVKNDLLISKDNLLKFQTIFLTSVTYLFLILTFFPVLFISVLSRNKLNAPLFISEIIECVYLQQILKEYSIKFLNYFCIYEREANICAFMLMKQGIWVNKIPSEVPLYFFNKIIVADQLSFCFAYQQEEYEVFKETMFVNKTELWAPEQILNAPARFLTGERKGFTPLYDIGFFSSGNWLRHKIGDVDLGYNDKENEELLLKTLIDYSINHNLKLHIFLHPLEKRKENRVDVLKYYATINHHSNIRLADFDKSSIEGFDEIDIGVALYSTLMFERLFLGFKTIIAPFDYEEFPLKGSSLRNISVSNVEELIEKLDLSLNLTNKEFFIKNGLQNYSKYLD